MKLKYIILSFLVSVSGVSFAQLTDTVQVKSNSFYEGYFNELWDNPLLLANYKINDFTQSELNYQSQKLNFKRRQTAQETDKYQFYTQGIYNYSDKLRVFGNFTAAKILEDELGFNFTSARTENQLILAPNYFYAPKAGNWDIQKYNIQGGANYNFDNGIMLGAILNYRNEKHYRKIDPRPEILVHNINGKAFLGYQFKKHVFSGFVGLGKNTEEAGIIYVDKLLNSITLEETFTKFNSGYGYTAFNATYDQFINRGITNIWGLGYQYQGKKNAVTLGYQYNKLLEDLYSKTILSTGIDELLINKNQITHKYQKIDHQFNTSYIYNGDNLNYQAKGFYTYTTHANYSVLAQGQNFKYVENKFVLDQAILKKNEAKTLYSVNLKATYSRNLIQDLLSNLYKKINYLEVSLSANTDLFKNEKNRINTEVFVSNYTALNSQLIYQSSGSNQTFANQVIFNDHGYDVTSKVTTGMQVVYDIKLQKSTFRINAAYKSLFATGNQYKEFTSNLVNKPNQYGSIGLAIIY